MLYKFSILGDAFDANYFKKETTRVLSEQSKSRETFDALVSRCKKG